MSIELDEDEAQIVVDCLNAVQKISQATDREMAGLSELLEKLLGGEHDL